MRRAIVASLLSSLALTAAAASNPVNDASAATPPPQVARPISTGITSPQMMYSTGIEIPASEIPDAFPNPARVVLKVSLDAGGSPTDIQVLQPLTQEVDARVVAAVKKFRWTPAVLDNMTIPFEMKLVVEVRR